MSLKKFYNWIRDKRRGFSEEDISSAIEKFFISPHRPGEWIHVTKGEFRAIFYYNFH